MRVVVQRCSRAEVRIDGVTVGQIGKGFVLLVGITDGDTEAQADLLAKKVAQMRVFEDTEGKMNLALKDVDGDVLSISQFTLYADCKKGNRPSFIRAARPETASP
ncbi:MAG: D-tyrosyl-tRNA(Tyr) deacylase, partial [Paludibacteraceae bacterium]|nr:D-tyrosyl-tRNA(Tyr) deacylase [Paludibacteraceae bacterium]MBQ6765370.1 D-tyrosyl-tRNA(Tyr) deacylase [Paludibacteraceae bacterium]